MGPVIASLAALLVLAQVSGCLAGQSTDFDNLVMKHMDAQRVNALCAAITLPDNAVAFKKCYGFADFQRTVVPGDDWSMSLASVSKTITFMVLYKALVDKGISITADVNSVIKESETIPANFRIYNPNYPDDPITFQHILQHKSSIVGDLDQGGELYAYGLDSPFSLDEFVVSFFTDRQVRGVSFYPKEGAFLKQKPGAKYKYSNVATHVAAWLAQQVAGKDFFVLSNTLTQAIGMTGGWRLQDLGATTSDAPSGQPRTSVPNFIAPVEYREQKQIYDIAYFRFNRNNEVIYNSPDWASGFFRTNAASLATWLNFFWGNNKGKDKNGNVIFTQEQIAQIFDQTNGALGFACEKEGQLGPNCGHNGSEGGIATDIYWWTAKNFGTVVLQSAKGGTTTDPIAQALYDYKDALTASTKRNNDLAFNLPVRAVSVPLGAPNVESRDDLSMVIYWDLPANVPADTKYEIDRTPAFDERGAIYVSTPEYVDSTVERRKTYKYRVRAIVPGETITEEAWSPFSASSLIERELALQNGVIFRISTPISAVEPKYRNGVLQQPAFVKDFNDAAELAFWKSRFVTMADAEDVEDSPLEVLEENLDEQVGGGGGGGTRNVEATQCFDDMLQPITQSVQLGVLQFCTQMSEQTVPKFIADSATDYDNYARKIYEGIVADVTAKLGDGKVCGRCMKMLSAWICSSVFVSDKLYGCIANSYKEKLFNTCPEAWKCTSDLLEGPFDSTINNCQCFGKDNPRYVANAQCAPILSTVDFDPSDAAFNCQDLLPSAQLCEDMLSSCGCGATVQQLCSDFSKFGFPFLRDKVTDPDCSSVQGWCALNTRAVAPSPEPDLGPE